MSRRSDPLPGRELTRQPTSPLDSRTPPDYESGGGSVAISIHHLLPIKVVVDADSDYSIPGSGSREIGQILKKSTDS